MPKVNLDKSKSKAKAVKRKQTSPRRVAVTKKRTLRSSTRATRSTTASTTTRRLDEPTASSDSVLLISSDSDSDIEISETDYPYPKTSTVCINLAILESSSNTLKTTSTTQNRFEIDNDLQAELNRINQQRTFSSRTDSPIIETSEISSLSNLLETDNTLELIENCCGTVQSVPQTPASRQIDTIDLVTPQTKNREVQETSTSTESAVKDSPARRSLECPVCWESLSTKQIYSTTCGHIFCKECVFVIVDTMKKCPQCRVTLNRRKIHPIFL